MMGKRWMTTLRKLPTIRPNRAAPVMKSAEFWNSVGKVSTRQVFPSLRNVKLIEGQNVLSTLKNEALAFALLKPLNPT